MIDGLRGAAVLKELTALAQNLEKKLSMPVSVEVVQKLMQSKDGYKYLTNVDGKLAEVLSKIELDTGVKYWADGVKNQTTNILTLENLVQKPQILQSEIFKSDVLSKAMGFEKLVEVVKEEFAKSAPIAAKAVGEAPKMTNNIANTQPQAQPQQEPHANTEAPNVIRLAAADTELVKTTATATTVTTPITNPQKPQDTQPTTAKEVKKEAEPKTAEEVKQKITTTQATIQTATETTASVKDAVLKELKAVVLPLLNKETVQSEPKTATQPQKSAEQKDKAADAKARPKDIKERLKDFKNVEASPAAPTKQEIEKAKLLKEEIKSAANENVTQAAKAVVAENISAVLMQNFELMSKDALSEVVKKLSDIIFGALPSEDKDEKMLKILEHLQKQLEQKADKTDKDIDKKTAKTETEDIDKEERKSVAAEPEEHMQESAQKTENPASKLKAQLLEELAKVNTKTDFQLLSNVAMALNKEVFTFVLEDKGVLQFKKKRQKELNAKTVEFYSAFETLGPVSGEITHIDGDTSLNLNVEFESTYRFLKENLKDLSFFDKKNVSIKHGIKEIIEIKSSFLDTTG
jgi:hypothetical protein